MTAFTPTPAITVTMYRLLKSGAYYQPLTPCSQTPALRDKWGCTAYCTDLVGPNLPCNTSKSATYPFSSENATVNIEGTSCAPGSSPYDCYLRDVTPLEVDIKASSRGNKPLSTVQAQAIAARTYTYSRAWGRDNSNNYQVFVPYYYDSLSQDQQSRVAAAVANVYYMSYYSSDAPIEALYGSDNRDMTTTGSQPYLLGVLDPISGEWGCFQYFDAQGRPVYGTNAVCGTGLGGMSQRGASRWGFGHTSSRGPAYTAGLQSWGDDQGNGDFWSVRWDNTYQVLTHYYTGIQVRNVNNGNAVLTPDRRFDVLQVCARPATNQLMVVLHNTGTVAWSSNLGVGLCWDNLCTPRELLGAVNPGQTRTLTLSIPPGTGILGVDVYTDLGIYGVEWWSNGSPPWFRQLLDQPVSPCPQQYLPCVNIH
jgi:hypothetical protein